MKGAFHGQFCHVLAKTIFAVAMLCVTTKAMAQSAISVTDTTGWTTWKTASGTMMTDTQNDQQTGQHTDDFVGDTTYAGMQQKAGTIGGTDYVLWRFRFDDYAGADKFGGNGGNVGLGMDLNGDAAIDIVLMFTEGSGNVNNRSRTITFGTPGTGLNNSPSTTTWSFASQTPITLTVNTTYDLVATNDGYNFAGTQDSWLTFGISFSDLQNGIRTYAPAAFANFTMTYSTMISYVAFTSTQNNALNQDLFGAPKSAIGSTTTYADLGSITPPQDAYGKVPEPATYAQLAALLLVGGLIAYRRRQSAVAGR